MAHPVNIDGFKALPRREQMQIINELLIASDCSSLGYAYDIAADAIDGMAQVAAEEEGFGTDDTASERYLVNRFLTAVPFEEAA